MRSCCSTPRTAVAGARSATSAQAPCRSTKRSSASAIIHISWTCARPTVDLLQRIDAKQECRSLETTDISVTSANPDTSWMTILAALAHELGHVRWADTVVALRAPPQKPAGGP